jgi:hypothetical protein
MKSGNLGLQTVTEFCAKHSISRQTFYREVRDQRLKLTRVRGSTRVSPAHEAEWLAGLEVVTGLAA